MKFKYIPEFIRFYIVPCAVVAISITVSVIYANDKYYQHGLTLL